MNRFPGSAAVGFLALVLATSAAHASELQDAIEANNIGQVKALLHSGANPNEQSIYGGPLNIAASNGFVEIAAVLIDAGANIETPGLSGTHPLHSAAGTGNASMAKLLLTRGAKVDALDSKGGTPLIAAALASDIGGGADVLKILLAAGADPRREDTANHMTALHYAGAQGRIQVAEILLNAGVDINLKDGQGSTALHHAAGDGRLAMVQFLISHGADVNIANNGGETPLRLASASPNIQELLVKSGAKQ